MIQSIKNSEYYSWGNNCSGWHLVKNPELSVIQELMPPGTFKQKHYHRSSRQFFYILKGIATFEIENKNFAVNAGEGINIPPFSKHQIKNQTQSDLEFIVISQPSSKADRVNDP